MLAAGAPRPAPPPGRPPPSARLPAALAVAGGVNPVDHGRTISRLASDLRLRGCLVVELAPRDLLDGGRRGAGGALLAAARQLIGAEAETDDVAGIRAWYEQEVVPVAMRGGSVVGAKGAAAKQQQQQQQPEAPKKRRGRPPAAAAAAEEEEEENEEEAAAITVAAVEDPTAAAAAAATFAAATAAAAAAAGAATTTTATTTATTNAAAAAPPTSSSSSSRRPALSVPPGTPPPIVFVIEAVEASDPAVLGDLLRLLQHAFVSFLVFWFFRALFFFFPFLLLLHQISFLPFFPSLSFSPPPTSSLQQSFDRLPIVAVLGVATSAVMAEAALPPAARRALSPARFRLARTATRAEVALGAALGGGAFPGILLHHRAAAAIDARFMDVDFTAADLGRVLEAHVGAHALRTPGVALAAALAASGGGSGGSGSGSGGGTKGKKKSVSFSPSPAAAHQEQDPPSCSGLERLELLIEGTSEPLQRQFAELAGFDFDSDAADDHANEKKKSKPSKKKKGSNKQWTSSAASELDRLRACWAGWAASLRWVSSAARALGFKAAADGYSLRELLRDGGAPSFMSKGQPGYVAVAALKERALRATPQAVRAALASLGPAVAAVEGAEELFGDELRRAEELIKALDGGDDEEEEEQQLKKKKKTEKKNADDENTAAAPTTTTTTSTNPLPLSRSAAGRRNALAAATAIAAAAADAAAHPSAAGAAALVGAVAERFLSTPPHALPSAAPCLVRGGKALMASLAGAPRAALHVALTQPDAYLGLKSSSGGGGGSDNNSNNLLLGDDDAVLLYRSLLMCDETVDIRELLVRFAVYYGHAGVREDDAGEGGDGNRRKKQRRKKIGHAGAQTTADGLVAPSVVQNLPQPQYQDQTSLSLSLFQASIPQPVVNFRERRRQAPASEVCARFQAALLELQLAGVVARGRKRGCVRRAIFPPASACV